VRINGEDYVELTVRTAGRGEADGLDGASLFMDPQVEAALIAGVVSLVSLGGTASAASTGSCSKTCTAPWPPIRCSASSSG